MSGAQQPQIFWQVQGVSTDMLLHTIPKMQSEHMLGQGWQSSGPHTLPVTGPP